MPVRPSNRNNGEPISPRKIRLPRKSHPSPLEGLSKALVAVEWGSDRKGRNWAVKYETFAKLAAGPEEGGKMVHSLRSMGSAALNFCAVAAGQIDLYWVCFSPVILGFGWFADYAIGGRLLGLGRRRRLAHPYRGWGHRC